MIISFSAQIILESSFCLVRILDAIFKPTFCMKVSTIVGEKKTSE